MPSLPQKPNNKVTAGALAGAIVTILLFVLGQFHVALDPSVATVVSTAISFVVAYLVKEPQQ